MDCFTRCIESIGPRECMNYNLWIQFIYSIVLIFPSVIVTIESNSGFSILLTAIAYIFYTTASLYIINRKQDPVYIGSVIGSTISMSILSVLTAVYWSQVSICNEVDVVTSEYTCKNYWTMKLICAVSSLQFLLQVIFALILYNWQNIVIAENQQYSEVPSKAFENDDASYFSVADPNYTNTGSNRDNEKSALII